MTQGELFQQSKSCYNIENRSNLYPQPPRYIYIFPHTSGPYISTFDALFLSFHASRLKEGRNRHASPGAPEVREVYGNNPPSEPRLGNPGPGVFGDPDPSLQVLRHLRANPCGEMAFLGGIFLTCASSERAADHPMVMKES